jgi:DNA-binding NarL/FixJ family response regulator
MEQRRWPASVLVAVRDLAAASFIESTLSKNLDFPVWVWHETDVHRACQASNAFLFRLVILDPRLPGQAPGEVLRAVKSAAPRTPLVLYGVQSEIPSEMEAWLAGAADVVPEGEAEALVAAVRRVLGAVTTLDSI